MCTSFWSLSLTGRSTHGRRDPGAFMKLELDAGEQEFLIQVLQRHQRELIWELARTDHSSFRSELREQLRLLERLIDKAQVIELTVK